MSIRLSILMVTCCTISVHPVAGQQSKPVAGREKESRAPEDQGSELLKTIRRQTEPILASMAIEHGYRLADGELVRRVTPPFAPIRMDYYRVGHPTQAEHIPRGPSAMVFHWEEGRLKGGGMTFGTENDAGYTLESLMDIVFDLKSQRVQASKALRRRRVAGDWVVERGKTFNAEKAREHHR